MNRTHLAVVLLLGAICLSTVAVFCRSQPQEATQELPTDPRVVEAVDALRARLRCPESLLVTSARRLPRYGNVMVEVRFDARGTDGQLHGSLLLVEWRDGYMACHLPSDGDNGDDENCTHDPHGLFKSTR